MALTVNAQIIRSDAIADTVVDDLTGAEWGVGLCGARITFERAATGLDGDFIHGIESGNHGVFAFEADVETCGTYKRLSCRGSFEFENSAEFRYAAYETNAGIFACTNPCEICPGTPVCVTDPFIRTTNLNLTCP